MRKQPIIILAFVLATTSCEDRFFPTVAAIGTPVAVVTTTPLLVITPTTARIPVGTTLRLATNAPFDQQTQIEFISLSPAIASVDQFGLVTAIIPGTVTVRVRFLSDPLNFATAFIEVVPVTVPVVTFP